MIVSESFEDTPGNNQKWDTLSGKHLAEAVG